jgi:hypothetical protein
MGLSKRSRTEGRRSTIGGDEREKLEADIQRAEQSIMKGNVSLSICVHPLTMIHFILSTKKQESFGGGQEYPSFGFM